MLRQSYAGKDLMFLLLGGKEGCGLNRDVEKWEDKGGYRQWGCSQLGRPLRIVPGRRKGTTLCTLVGSGP